MTEARFRHDTEEAVRIARRLRLEELTVRDDEGTDYLDRRPVRTAL